jgi:hypothetical protein
MNIFKLKFTDKAEALQVLEQEGVLIPTEEGFIYGQGVHAVVELGIICLDPNVDPPIYADGYHYDVMADQVIDFGAHLIEPKSPKHAFAGYSTTDEYVPTEEMTNG